MRGARDLREQIRVLMLRSHITYWIAVGMKYRSEACKAYLPSAC